MSLNHGDSEMDESGLAASRRISLPTLLMLLSLLLLLLLLSRAL